VKARNDEKQGRMEMSNDQKATDLRKSNEAAGWDFYGD